MIEPVEVKTYLSLIESDKDTPQEALYDFALQYLVNHTYVNSKKLAIYYLCEVYDLTPTRNEFNKVKKALKYKFRQTIHKLLQERKIIGYSPKLFKRVELPKIDYDTKNLGPDIRLIFDGISFKNPKFYDI